MMQSVIDNALEIKGLNVKTYTSEYKLRFNLVISYIINNTKRH
ncbi:hypothetical protein LDVICp037 [lymphocystis disease virus-China]|uniref:Uncharacterized protein n=1 Tax=lymphocystis disease virus-China TaxID=256729 RepID=Q678H3_9VIRU|nr:hypothetical protein LDVICp037 [lymphocystis disease virus-China]AAU10884.1 hypothetical protein [lymphocystis disease virus-China]